MTGTIIYPHFAGTSRKLLSSQVTCSKSTVLWVTGRMWTQVVWLQGLHLNQAVWALGWLTKLSHFCGINNVQGPKPLIRPKIIHSGNRSWTTSLETPLAAPPLGPLIWQILFLTSKTKGTQLVKNDPEITRKWKMKRDRSLWPPETPGLKARAKGAGHKDSSEAIPQRGENRWWG